MSHSQLDSEYLERIKKDHSHQGRQLNRLRKTLDEPINLGALVELLAEMRGELAEHFQLEEDGGYFDDAVAHAPRLTGQADRLRHQHVELLEKVDDLLQRATTAQGIDRSNDEIQELGHQFIQDLVEHERGENLLVTEAYERDIGGED